MSYEPVALEEIRAAARRISGTIVRTPLVRLGAGKLVCVVSGGNIDTPALEAILAGNTP